MFKYDDFIPRTIRFLLFGETKWPKYDFYKDDRELIKEIMGEKHKVEDPITIIVGPEYYEKIMCNWFTASTEKGVFICGLKMQYNELQDGYIISRWE